MDKIAVKFDNFSYKYPISNNWVLKGVNLDINYGELLLLTGSSGEGKSTLLSCINGIIPNLIQGDIDGIIQINGVGTNLNINMLSKIIGSVLQDPESQIINSKIEDEIAFGCENLGMNRDKIKRNIKHATSLMELESDWSTKNLSGGQKQRLMTAAILAMEQKILLLDEPLANLDIKGAHTLLSTLKSLAKKGYAIVLAEHRLELCLPYADKVIKLEDGEINPCVDNKSVMPSLSEKVVLPTDKATSNDMIFKVDSISYDVNKVEILKDISTEINRGDRIVVIGENGSGKTTFVKNIANIIKPTKGAIYQYLVSNKEYRNTSVWFSKVGYVYQNPNYQLFMPTVYEEINFMADNDNITEVLVEKFNLCELRDRHPQSLSEGQKRKLTIACILAMQPEVVLLDEPTVGQDKQGLAEIIKILNEQNLKHNTTLITITHDYDCAMKLGEKIIWLENKTVKKQGNIDLLNEYFKSQANCISKKVNRIIL
jgi:energy-coupling factor transporter ATP-binding protein EcfA2